MRKFNLIITLMIGIVLIMSFVSSQEEISLLDGQIVGKGVKPIISTETDSVGKTLEKIITLTFVDRSAKVCIEEDCFENIVPQKEAKHPTYLEFDENGEVIKSDFTVNEKGGTYVFGSTQIYAPPNSRVFFDKKTGIRIIAEDEAEFTETPKQKDLNLPSEYITTIESKNGKSFKLPGGFVISGQLLFDKGQAFIEDKATISGVEFETKREPFKFLENTPVFFDGQEHNGDYISLNPDNGKLTLSTKTGNDVIIANFKQGNPFLRIDERDYVSIRVLTNSKIEITNRDSQGLIPRINTNGDFELDQGRYRLSLLQEKIFHSRDSSIIPSYDSIEYELGSSPVEIFTFGYEGRRSTFRNKKILVDNFNRYSFVDEKETDFYYDDLNGFNFRFSPRLDYNYPTEESVTALIGKDRLFISPKFANEGTKKLFLWRLRDYWNLLDEEQKKDIRIEITPDFPNGFDVGAYTIDNTAFFNPDHGLRYFEYNTFS